jgi:hypothetical protein
MSRRSYSKVAVLSIGRGQVYASHLGMRGMFNNRQVHVRWRNSEWDNPHRPTRNFRLNLTDLIRGSSDWDNQVFAGQ